MHSGEIEEDVVAPRRVAPTSRYGGDNLHRHMHISDISFCSGLNLLL